MGIKDIPGILNIQDKTIEDSNRIRMDHITKDNNKHYLAEVEKNNIHNHRNKRDH